MSSPEKVSLTVKQLSKNMLLYDIHISGTSSGNDLNAINTHFNFKNKATAITKA